MTKTFEKVEAAARDAFALDIHGVHGESHWASVAEIGAALASRTPGADFDGARRKSRFYCVWHPAPRKATGTGFEKRTG
jgi:hypothetical protein